MVTHIHFMMIEPSEKGTLLGSTRSNPLFALPFFRKKTPQKMPPLTMIKELMKNVLLWLTHVWIDTKIPKNECWWWQVLLVLDQYDRWDSLKGSNFKQKILVQEEAFQDFSMFFAVSKQVKKVTPFLCLDYLPPWFLESKRHSMGCHFPKSFCVFYTTEVPTCFTGLFTKLLSFWS